LTGEKVVVEHFFEFPHALVESGFVQAPYKGVALVVQLGDDLAPIGFGLSGGVFTQADRVADGPEGNMSC
jgi:hypothetical protein